MKTPANILVKQIKEIREARTFDSRSASLPTWCPGCGYFGIQHALTAAIHGLELPLHKCVIVSGIGCAGRYPFFSATYGLHTVHGRTLPVSTGVKLANPELHVFAIGGDGDGLAIGGGHLAHAIRRDIDVNYLLFDNSIYGLTKGQPSPSSPIGTVSKASPYGATDKPLNATLMALTYGAGFVARLFAGDPTGTAEAIKEGINHKGFSLFHMYSTCVTFDKTFKTWANLKTKVHSLPEGYDPTDFHAAFDTVLKDDFAMGIIYRRD
jgi:2-oxoglutarate ferredoxin oxidoreductase subunit beta